MVACPTQTHDASRLAVIAGQCRDVAGSCKEGSCRPDVEPISGCSLGQRSPVQCHLRRLVCRSEHSPLGPFRLFAARLRALDEAEVQNDAVSASASGAYVLRDMIVRLHNRAGGPTPK